MCMHIYIHIYIHISCIYIYICTRYPRFGHGFFFVAQEMSFWTSIPWLLESFSHYTWLLSCPVHCGPSITPGFLAGLISGTSLGLLLGFWCFCRPPAPFFTPAPWHSQSPPSTWSSQTSGEIVRRFQGLGSTCMSDNHVAMVICDLQKQLNFNS